MSESTTPNTKQELREKILSLLQENYPVQHEDSDHRTCDSLYHHCLYPDAKKESKTVRKFADGYSCIAVSYYGTRKECTHPKEFWKPGKCNCGAVREQKTALKDIEQLLTDTVKAEVKNAVAASEESLDHYWKKQVKIEVNEALDEVANKSSLVGAKEAWVPLSAIEQVRKRVSDER